MEAATNVDAASFAGGVGTRVFVRVVRLELRPFGQIARSVHMVATRAAIVTVRGALRDRLEPRLAAGFPSFRVRFGLTLDGTLTFRETVQPTNITLFRQRLIRLVTDLQERYNIAYGRAGLTRTPVGVNALLGRRQRGTAGLLASARSLRRLA